MGKPNLPYAVETYAVIVRTAFDDVLARVFRSFDEANDFARRVFEDEPTARNVLTWWENIVDIDIGSPVLGVDVITLAEGLPIHRTASFVTE